MACIERPITAVHFVERTGFLPEQDDLERCNCPLAGQIGHMGCGWDDDRDLPRFLVFGSRKA